MLTEHQSHLHMLTPTTQAQDRVHAGFGVAQRIQRYMCSASSNVSNGLRNTSNRLGINDRYRPQTLRQCQLVVGNIHGHNVGTQCIRNHDGRQSNPTTTMHGDPLPRCNLTLIHNGPKRRHKAAAQAGSRRKINALWQGNQIKVGTVQRNVFGERAPMRKTRLKLMMTNLLMPRMTFSTSAAATYKWHRNPIAHSPLGNILTYSSHHTSQPPTIMHVRAEPVNPSQVFFGLMVGAILCLPRNDPAK